MADIDVFQTVTSVSFQVEPNTNVININKVTTSGGNQDLQSVTDIGASTTNPITANSFVKSGGTGTNVLLDNGNTVALSSIGGATNLSPTQTATNFTINSDTGTDATIPLGNGTLAGATLNDYTTAEKNKLGGIASGAEVNVNADWNATTGDAQILNKPTIPSISGLATVTYVDTQDALKVDKIIGKGLSTEDYTTTEKNKLAAISGTNTGDQNLQSVTNLGSSTTTPITANSFVKSGGTSSQILAADGSVITAGTNITISGGTISSVGGAGGGGSSVNYYLNGGTSQGTFGGATYYEFSKTAVTGTGADFNRNTNGYIASFITDVADPSSLLIPAGNWNLEFFFSSSSAGGSPSFYVELYKYDGTTFTLIASDSANPEGITNGTTIDAYFTPLAVPETVLTVNDRLAIRVYVNASSKTITLHTQNGHLCEVITTLTSGLTALNGLQAQVQNFSVGTSGTDFAINSSGNTHTFNLPDASATARGAITTGAQTIAGAKTFNSPADVPITALSQSEYGIFAGSDNNAAIFAQSTNGDGIQSFALGGGIGVFCSSDSNYGIYGTSFSAAGGVFETMTGSNIAEFKTSSVLKAYINSVGTVIGTGLNASGQTINTIASFDASKNVVSLPLATYPSLTELSLLKGVTGSSVQTQLNGKVSTNTAITGATNTKITYDAKGLVTSGTTLIESDIPTLSQSKVTNLTTDLAGKQAALQSTVNIKSVNGNSLLGSGDLTVSASTPSQSAFTILANNTNASAVPTEKVFENITNATYDGATPTWSGTTAPSGAIQHTYSLSQVGNMVTLVINLSYATAGSNLTGVNFDLPSTAPTPALPTSVSVALDVISYITGAITTSKASAVSNLAISSFRLKSTSPNVCEVSIARTAANYRYAYATIQYFV